MILWLSGVALAQIADPLPDWSVSGPAGAYGLAVGDIDGDGATDLVWSDTAGDVHQALHDPSALLAAPSLVDLGGRSAIGEVVLLDVDLDGFADLLVRTSGPPEVLGVLGGPTGLTAPSLHLPDGRLTDIGDVDGDGAADLAIGLVSWRAAGGGPVEDAVIPGNLVYAGSRPWAVGDVNGDGVGELLVPNHQVSGAYWDSQDGPAGLFERAGGGWAPAWSVDLDGGTAALAVVADVDGDGALEIVSADLSSEDEALWGTLSVLDDLANPAGPTVVTRTEIDLDAGQGFALASLGDTDGDGVDEIVMSVDGRIRELPWDPVLGFDLVAAPRMWSRGGGSLALGVLVTADVDGDGTRDVVATWTGEGQGEVTVWLTGDGPPVEPGDTGTPADTGTPGPTGTDTAQDTEPSEPTDPVDEDEASGCGCATGAPSVGWLGLAALGAARRRVRAVTRR